MTRVSPGLRAASVAWSLGRAPRVLAVSTITSRQLATARASSCLASIMSWLGAGELLNLAAGWAPDDVGAGSSSPCPGVCAFRLTVPFGANASYSLAVIPLFAGRVVAGPPLRALCGSGPLTRLADQWPGMGAMPGERPRKAASRSLGPAVA